MININQLIESDLIVRGVDKSLLQELPFFLKRAIVKLQNVGVLPYKTEEYYVEDKKDEKLDLDGDLVYNYFKLPEDFRELEYLYVKGSTKPYEWISYDRFYENPEGYKYTIDYVELVSGEPTQPVLLLSPFPTDEKIIEYKYKMDGSEFSLRHIDEKYWEAIISEVRNMYNVGSALDANLAVDELKKQLANPQGNTPGLNHIVATRGRFFGGKNIR